MTDVDAVSLATAFDRTRYGLLTVGRGIGPRRRALLSIGDDADDFALAHAYQRLYGRGSWLPLTWWAPNGSTDQSVSFVVRSAAMGHIMRGGSITVSTTSVDSGTIDSIVEEIRQPLTWAEGGQEKMARLYEERITPGPVDWSTTSIQYLAVVGQFDQDYAIPITRSDAGDVEMVVPCPSPAINYPALATCERLHWQVDVELVEAVTPRGRGLDGHTLLAEGQDPYLTWIRSGRDGVTYESERFNLIAAGTPPAARLARPRLRAPSLATWADLMAAQDGKSTRISAAGRRVEVMRQLWGDRAALASLFAGPMLPVLRVFRPSPTRPDSADSNGDLVVLPTGGGEHLWEGYLTFEGMLSHASTDGDAATYVRNQIDEMLERGILRRGLILGCSQCGRPAFVVVDDLAQVNRCSRCSALNHLSQARWRQPKTEPRWYYDLHPTVREHLSQDGEIPLLLSHDLRSKSRSYVDAPELELVDATAGPLAEADLVAISDGQLITAEVKRPGSLGKGKELRRAVAKRALLAELLRADQIVIATADIAWQRGSIDAICNEINNRPWRIAPPRARLISGLGTNTVHDHHVDHRTGSVSPWPARGSQN